MGHNQTLNNDINPFSPISDLLVWREPSDPKNSKLFFYYYYFFFEIEYPTFESVKVIANCD